MSSKDIAIKVENLSKRYRLGLKEEIHENFAGAIFDFIKSPLKNYRKYRSLYRFDDITGDSNTSSSDILWALNNVSFEVKRGEMLGIIGVNGSGKSTLLKILSRVTDPTSGCVEVRGKISSLLEVGTGFHPELTGRENVYLNGIVLGMRKKEVDVKFDEIVDFSGVEKFINTPVKRYSSGMKVRLAFAVAAHLEPDILLIDEVLAVGDIAFQRKCMGKMSEVVNAGRTILFVSHNMGAIENLCVTGMCIDEGRIVMIGDISSVISLYLKKNANGCAADPKQWKHIGNGDALITEATLLDSSGKVCNSYKLGETLIVEFGVEFYKFFACIDNIVLEVSKVDTGTNVLHLLSQDSGFCLENINPGKRRFRVQIPNCMLYPGTYQISIYIGDGRPGGFDKVQNVLNFTIVQSSISKRTIPFYPKQGIFYSQSFWNEL